MVLEHHKNQAYWYFLSSDGTCSGDKPRIVLFRNYFVFLEKSPKTALSHLEGEMGPLCFSFKIFFI